MSPQKNLLGRKRTKESKSEKPGKLDEDENKYSCVKFKVINSSNNLTLKEEVNPKCNSKKKNNIIKKVENIDDELTTHMNKKFFEYENFSQDDSFHKIINSQAENNEELLRDGLKGVLLYSQNRDIPFEEIKKYIDGNEGNDKPVLISLNNNNGVGKTHLLEIIRHRENLKDILFLPRVEMSKSPAPYALLEAMLESIRVCFGFKEIALSKEEEIVFKKTAIKNICERLEIILNKKNILEQLEIIEEEKRKVGNVENAIHDSSDIKGKKRRVGKVENALNDLFDNYYKLEENKKKIIDIELVLDKVKDKKAVYFCFDEIGNVKSTKEESETNVIGKVEKSTKVGLETIEIDDSYRNIFVDIPEAYKQLIAMDEIRELLNIILAIPRLGVIVSGKDGIESFMGKRSKSPNIIKHINLPPLLEKYIEPILKFELYKNSNSNLRLYLKDTYPQNCTKKKQDELEEKMGLLLNKLKEYTAGHPRILKYTLNNLMKRDKLDSIDKELMNKLEPFQLPDIFDRYNNSILYQYFLNQMKNPILSPFKIKVEDKNEMHKIKGKELLYIFYLLNKGKNKDLNVNTIKKAFDFKDIFGLDDLLNSIGLSYIKSYDDQDIFETIIPKYISDKLDEIEINTFTYKYAITFLFCKYELGKEKLNKIISILSYAEIFFKDHNIDNFENSLLFIEGYSSGDNYLKKIFDEIGNLKQNRIVMFKNISNYAIDGLMIKYNGKKVIVHLIQVKSGQESKKKNIFAQISRLEEGITRTQIKKKKQNSIIGKKSIEHFLLKNWGLQSNEIKITYLLISKKGLRDIRKNPLINFKRVEYEENVVSGKILKLTDKISESIYIDKKNKDEKKKK